MQLLSVISAANWIIFKVHIFPILKPKGHIREKYLVKLIWAMPQKVQKLIKIKTYHNHFRLKQYSAMQNGLQFYYFLLYAGCH